MFRSGLRNPASVALRATDVYVLSAAYSTTDPDPLGAHPQNHR
ncbi:hypothetical protein ABZS61_31195 [Streptomyces sp. NPDC005566]